MTDTTFRAKQQGKREKTVIEISSILFGTQRTLLPDPLTRETKLLFFFFLSALGVHAMATAMKFQTGTTFVLEVGEKEEEKIEMCSTFFRLQGAPFLALVEKDRFRVLMSVSAAQFHNWGHIPVRGVK